MLPTTQKTRLLVSSLNLPSRFPKVTLEDGDTRGTPRNLCLGDFVPRGLKKTFPVCYVYRL